MIMSVDFRKALDKKSNFPKKKPFLENHPQFDKE